MPAPRRRSHARLWNELSGEHRLRERRRPVEGDGEPAEAWMAYGRGELPSWNSQSEAFALGVKATDPSVKIYYAVIGPAA